MNAADLGRETAPFVFVVPLRPQASSTDWAGTIESLRQTLRSVQQQSFKQFKLFIACQDKPDVPEMSDPRFEWVSVDFPPAPPEDVDSGSADKRSKVLYLGTLLRQRGFDKCYCMFLDADDLVRKDLVSYVMSDDNRTGYIAAAGYLLDLDTGVLGQIDDKFWASCGSSTITYLNNDDFPTPENHRSYYAKMSRHIISPIEAEKAGRPLIPLGFPAVVYTLNHPDSIMARTKGSRRPRGRSFSAKETASILSEDFGLVMES